MSPEEGLKWLPIVAGILVVLFVNVFVGAVTGGIGVPVTGDTQLLVWIGSLLAGAFTTATLQ